MIGKSGYLLQESLRPDRLQWHYWDRVHLLQGLLRLQEGCCRAIFQHQSQLRCTERLNSGKVTLTSYRLMHETGPVTDNISWTKNSVQTWTTIYRSADTKGSWPPTMRPTETAGLRLPVTGNFSKMCLKLCWVITQHFCKVWFQFEWNALKH